jgi:hypothetical protein
VANPRVDAEVRKRRGTFRADRDYDNRQREPSLTERAVRLYWERFSDACTRAASYDVTDEIEHLREVERAFTERGVYCDNGEPFHGSDLVEIIAGERR